MQNYKKNTTRERSRTITEQWITYLPTQLDAFVSLYLRESVQEGFGKSFTPAALSERILATKNLGLFMLNLEAHAQLGDKDLGSVIEAGVQALQHRLGGQVQLSE